MRRRRCTCKQFYTNMSEISNTFDQQITIDHHHARALGLCRSLPLVPMRDPVPVPVPLEPLQLFETTLDDLVMPILRLFFPRRLARKNA